MAATGTKDPYGRYIRYKGIYWGQWSCVQSHGAACIWNPSCSPLKHQPGLTGLSRWWFCSVASGPASWMQGWGRFQMPTCISHMETVLVVRGSLVGKSLGGTFMLTHPHHWSAGNWSMQSWNKVVKTENNELFFQTNFLKWLNICLRPNTVNYVRNSSSYTPVPSPQCSKGESASLW